MYVVVTRSINTYFAILEADSSSGHHVDSRKEPPTEVLAKAQAVMERMTAKGGNLFHFIFFIYIYINLHQDCQKKRRDNCVL